MKLQHCILFLSLWLMPLFSKSEDFSCYCIKYDNDFMFVDGRMGLGELESDLFLFDLHYLSNDHSSILEKITISKNDSSDVLGDVLSGKALTFTVRDLEALSQVDVDVVKGDIDLGDGKRVCKAIFDDPKAWEQDEDGKIKINVFIQGGGADYIGLGVLKERLASVAREKFGDDISSDASHASTDSLVVLIGAPLVVTVIAGGVHTLSHRKHGAKGSAAKEVKDGVPAKGR